MGRSGVAKTQIREAERRILHEIVTWPRSRKGEFLLQPRRRDRMKLYRIPVLMGTGCLALLIGAYVAGAQQPNSTQPNSGSTPTTPGSPEGTAVGNSAGSQSGDMNNGGSKASDKHFVKEAMAGSMAEIQLGQMARQKASSDDVKEFGQKMVQDHQKLNDQMQPIASQMGVTPPSDLSAKDKALQKKLEGLNGADFDKAYMSAMVQDHKKDLAAFKREAASASDPQVKDVAQQGSQVVAEHLQMAQDIAQKVGASSMGGSHAKHANAGGDGSTTSNPK
jgi:putative membrane protein